MDSARDKESGIVIDAETLWELDHVDRRGYECPGCGIPVFPASYSKENKRRPYFRPSDKSLHEPDCGIDGIQVFVQQARVGRIGWRVDGFPVPFANRLVLVDERPAVAAERNSNGATSSRTSTRGSKAPGRGYHGHTVNTIRPLCRTYLDFPHDRVTLPIAFPDSDVSNYETLFARLPTNVVRMLPPLVRIYYAPLLWNRPELCAEFGEWRVDAGDWDHSARRRSTNTYRIRLEWAEWTPRQRNTLQREIELCRSEARAARKEKLGTKAKAWLFCVGAQSDTDPTIIVVNDHRLVCCLVREMYVVTRPFDPHPSTPGRTRPPQQV